MFECRGTAESRFRNVVVFMDSVRSKEAAVVRFRDLKLAVLGSLSQL